MRQPASVLRTENAGIGHKTCPIVPGLAEPHVDLPDTLDPRGIEDSQLFGDGALQRDGVGRVAEHSASEFVTALTLAAGVGQALALRCQAHIADLVPRDEPQLLGRVEGLAERLPGTHACLERRSIDPLPLGVVEQGTHGSPVGPVGEHHLGHHHSSGRRASIATRSVWHTPRQSVKQ